MTEIRVKDKLFLAAVVPAALLGLYWWGWRAPAAARAAAAERRLSALVAEEDFEAEKARAGRELAAARAELAAERAVPAPQSRVKGDPAESLAARERAVLGVFRECGLVAFSGAAADVRGDGAAQPARSGGGEALSASGVRPDPVRRVYVLDGAYPDMVKALEAFAGREMAVVPEGVSMGASGRGRWRLEVWL